MRVSPDTSTIVEEWIIMITDWPSTSSYHTLVSCLMNGRNFQNWFSVQLSCISIQFHVSLMGLSITWTQIYIWIYTSNGQIKKNESVYVRCTRPCMLYVLSRTVEHNSVAIRKLVVVREILYFVFGFLVLGGSLSLWGYPWLLAQADFQLKKEFPNSVVPWQRSRNRGLDLLPYEFVSSRIFAATGHGKQSQMASTIPCAQCAVYVYKYLPHVGYVTIHCEYTFHLKHGSDSKSKVRRLAFIYSDETLEYIDSDYLATTTVFFLELLNFW